MPIHIEPVFFTVRVFPDGKKWGDEYEAVITVQKMDHIGYCSACHGTITLSGYRELERQLKKYGITKLKWRRAGKELL